MAKKNPQHFIAFLRGTGYGRGQTDQELIRSWKSRVSPEAVELPAPLIIEQALNRLMVAGYLEGYENNDEWPEAANTALYLLERDLE